mmetsp:Transcript_39037/g.57329  ORF Transcript_39037/g.57329 Transcript_39037/m.57329 type:complete len:789 (-) Transcript_39037:593-2959(-)
MKLLQPSPTPTFIGHAIPFTLTTSISLAIYLRTVSSSIAGGDAGELVAEGCQLGTAHPPGYPLYTILVFLVTKFGRTFGGSPAYCANVMSCFFGAITSGIISQCVLLLSYFNVVGSSSSSTSRPNDALIPLVAATAAGLLNTFSPLAWQYSISAEVFSLHNLFVSLIVYATIQLAVHKTNCLLLVGAFLCGIALTNQHTAILLEIPLVLWVILRTVLYKNILLMTKAALCFVSGLSIYATLPILALRFPHAGSWGDVTSLSGFIRHFLRSDYGTLQLFSGDDTGSEGTVERVSLWLYDFATIQAGHPCLIIFLVWGCILLWRRPKTTYNREKHVRRSLQRDQIKITSRSKVAEWDTSDVGRSLVSSLVFYLVVFHTLANLPLSEPLLFGVHQRFWMQPNILCFIFIGVGLTKCAQIISKKSMSRSIFAITAMSLVLRCSYYKSILISDQKTNEYFSNYARSILDTLPQNSLLLINYDQQWTSVRYLQECENIRTDVSSINLSMMSYKWWETKRKLYPKVSFPGTHYTMENTQQWIDGGFTLSELLDANYQSFGGKIFVGGRITYTDQSYLSEYDEIPHGLVRHIMKKNYEDGTVESFRKRSLKAWRIVAGHHVNNLPDETKYPRETWEWTIRREFFDHFMSRATHLLDMAVTMEGKNEPVLKSLAEAAFWLELSAVHDSDISLSPALKKNVGLAYMHMVRNKEKMALPYVEDIFSGKNNTDFISVMNDIWLSQKLSSRENDWKSWASQRWQTSWKEFLDMDGAKEEPSYYQVKAIYDTVMDASRKKKQ